MRKLALYLAAMALVALAVAGCGGDDDGDTAAPATPPPAETPAALSKEELLAQGDAICAEVNAAVGTLASTESDDRASQAAELYAGMVERLEDLGAPSDDSAGYSAFLAAAEELAQAESDVELAAERGEAEGLVSAEAEASSALASFQAAASDFGFEQCGEGPSAPVPGGAAGGGTAEEPAEGAEEEAGGEEAAEEEVEEAPETEAGGAGAGAGGGAEAGGGGSGGGGETGGSSGGIGPG